MISRGWVGNQLVFSPPDVGVFLRQADVGKDAAGRLAGYFGGIDRLVVERLNCRENDGFSFALKAAVRFRPGRRLICFPLSALPLIARCSCKPSCGSSRVEVFLFFTPASGLIWRASPNPRTSIPSLFVQHLALAYPQNGAFEGKRLQEKHMDIGFVQGWSSVFR